MLAALPRAEAANLWLRMKIGVSLQHGLVEARQPHVLEATVHGMDACRERVRIWELEVGAGTYRSSTTSEVHVHNHGLDVESGEHLVHHPVALRSNRTDQDLGVVDGRHHPASPRLHRDADPAKRGLVIGVVRVEEADQHIAVKDDYAHPRRTSSR